MRCRQTISPTAQAWSGGPRLFQPALESVSAPRLCTSVVPLESFDHQTFLINERVIPALRAQFHHFIGCARQYFRQERDHRLRVGVMNRNPELFMLAYAKAHAAAESGEEFIRRYSAADRNGNRTGVFDVSWKILPG